MPLFFLALILVLKIVYALLRNTGQSSCSFLCSFTCLPILPVVYTSFNTSLFPQKHVLFELARTCPLFFEIQFHIHFLFEVLKTFVWALPQKSSFCQVFTSFLFPPPKFLPSSHNRLLFSKQARSSRNRPKAISQQTFCVQGALGECPRCNAKCQK